MLYKPRILVLGEEELAKTVCQLLINEPNAVIFMATKAKKNHPLLNVEQAFPQVAFHFFDWQEDFKQKLKESKIQLLIYTGPFVEDDYRVAQACIELKIHYMDLANGREFVMGIKKLDESAKLNKVMVISGASVSSLISVIVGHFVKQFSVLREIEVMTNSHEVMLQDILGQIGKPFQRLEKGEWKTVYGWQNMHHRYYGDNLGMRWQANMEIPDLVLLPAHYPMLKTVVCYAGLPTLVHWLVALMAFLRRLKLVNHWQIFHRFLLKLSRRSKVRKEGMVIHLKGSSLEYQPLDIKWTLISCAENGLLIPIIILVRKILQGDMVSGAFPGFGLFSLAQFDEMITSLDIYYLLETLQS